MAAGVKHIVFFGTLNNTAGQTISQASQPSFALDLSGYSKMDVLVNVRAMIGTNFKISVQERFSDAGFVETANTGTVTTNGPAKYYLANEGQSGQSGVTGATYGFAGLGRGTDKQVVCTTSSLTQWTADVYFVFYN